MHIFFGIKVMLCILELNYFFVSAVACCLRWYMAIKHALMCVLSFIPIGESLAWLVCANMEAMYDTPLSMKKRRLYVGSISIYL